MKKKMIRIQKKPNFPKAIVEKIYFNSQAEALRMNIVDTVNEECS